MDTFIAQRQNKQNKCAVYIYIYIYILLINKPEIKKRDKIYEMPLRIIYTD